jgi:hypothetical protein
MLPRQTAIAPPKAAIKPRRVYHQKGRMMLDLRIHQETWAEERSPEENRKGSVCADSSGSERNSRQL